MNPGWIITNQDETLFVKRTAQFGPFYGKVLFTSDREDARVWSRERDAVRAAKVVEYHGGKEWMPDEVRTFGPAKAVRRVAA